MQKVKKEEIVHELKKYTAHVNTRQRKEELVKKLAKFVLSGQASHYPKLQVETVQFKENQYNSKNIQKSTSIEAKSSVSQPSSNDDFLVSPVSKSNDYSFLQIGDSPSTPVQVIPATPIQETPWKLEETPKSDFRSRILVEDSPMCTVSPSNGLPEQEEVISSDDEWMDGQSSSYPKSPPQEFVSFPKELELSEDEAEDSQESSLKVLIEKMDKLETDSQEEQVEKVKKSLFLSSPTPKQKSKSANELVDKALSCIQWNNCSNVTFVVKQLNIYTNK